MPLQIVREDITNIHCDAIVNAANSTLLGGGGVDGAIHRAAGKELLKECKALGGCDTGDAKLTGAYNLPAKYVIHTVGPIWYGGNHNEESLLISCYKKSLNLAIENDCESIAFPLISSGAYGYPKDKAFKIAVDTITDFIMQNDILVYIVLFDKSAVSVSKKLFSDISEYIDDNYVDEHHTFNEQIRILPPDEYDAPMQSPTFSAPMSSSIPFMPGVRLAPAPDSYEEYPDDSFFECETCKAPLLQEEDTEKTEDLGVKLMYLDESFSEMLLRLIDEKGMKDSECYKKANIDRKLFSKIRSNPAYKPSKPTVLAFCIALELSLAETQEMLLKAGFALSHSNKFDVIVEYFIKNGNYNVFQINETLFAFDQCLLA